MNILLAIVGLLAPIVLFPRPTSRAPGRGAKAPRPARGPGILSTGARVITSASVKTQPNVSSPVSELPAGAWKGKLPGGHTFTAVPMTPEEIARVQQEAKERQSAIAEFLGDVFGAAATGLGYLAGGPVGAAVGTAVGKGAKALGKTMGAG